MPEHPSKIWKELPPETRLAAAEAFWRDDDASDVQVQHAEAIVMLARRLNFRAKTIQSLALERRAKHLAHVPDVSEGIATRALIAYHFSAQRPLMGAFLDALGIAHDSGLITAEQVTPPAGEQIAKAAETVRQQFPAADVDLYLRTLAALDGDTWAGVETVLPLSH
jgi:hypothetical protein